MKIRFPLFAQIIAVFFCNILLLLAICFFFFSSQFNFAWETLLYSPVGLRVQLIAFVVDRQIRALPVQEWNQVLTDFGESYGIKLYLFDSRGRQLAGDPIVLPKQVMQRIQEPPPHFREGFDVPKPAGAHDGRPPGSSPPAPPHPDLPPLPDSTARPDLLPPDLSHVPDLPLVPDRSPFPRPPGRFVIHTSNPDMTWIAAFIFTNQGFAQPGTLLAATPNLWQTRLSNDFAPTLLLISAVFFLSLLVWWPFIYTITSDLDRLTSTTEKIAEGKFVTAPEIRRFDEIGQLAQSINIMSAKLRMFVSGQRRFLGDIAHELCSPIARQQIAIEILQASCSKEQTAALNDIREEVEQMSTLINELLAFSKAGITGKELQLVSIDLEALLLKVSSQASLKTAPVLEIRSPVVCQGDELLLERAFGNILRNAERYAPDSGPVIIKAERIEKEIVIKFADSGPGVPPEVIEFLGEPFYRPESSRNRSSGGVGLGLAIVKTCIEACQGRVTLRNRQPMGLEVELRLPAVT